MHRPFLITAAALALALGACERHAEVASEAKDTGNSLGAAAKDLAHDPNVKRAEADLKAMGRDLGSDARSSASSVKAASQDLAASAKRAAHDVRGGGKRSNRDPNG